MTDQGRILIADDDETFLHSTADLLRREGYECTCAIDAQAAAEELSSGEFDLLIADIKMPGNPNLELVKDLPRLRRGMQVILVTGYPSVESAIESVELPVAAYLLKPIDFVRLKNQVRAAIEKRRLFHALGQTRERLEDWIGDLKKIENGASKEDDLASSMPVHLYLDLTFRNVAGALADLRQVTEAASAEKADHETCRLLNCPRLKALTSALSETIQVLERTKTAFKSKDLGLLRRKLERIVSEEEAV
jgi:DNA-binding response OmpR family regulator